MEKHVVEVLPHLPVEEESIYILQDRCLRSKRTKSTERLGEEVPLVGVSLSVPSAAKRLTRNACGQEPNVPRVVSPIDSANIAWMYDALDRWVFGNRVVLKGLTRVRIDLEHVQVRESGSLEPYREPSRSRKEIDINRFEATGQLRTLQRRHPQGGRFVRQKKPFPA